MAGTVVIKDKGDNFAGITGNRLNVIDNRSYDNPLPIEIVGTGVAGSYTISDIDEGSTNYFGFLKSDGSWKILRLTDTQARYCFGSSDYSTNWTNRTSLTYNLFNEV